MFQQIYDALYHMDLWAATAIFCGVIIVWSVIGAIFRERMRVVGAVLAIISAALILYITLFSRSQGPISHQIRPFATITLGAEHPALYRAALMNIFLFVPLGMALPYIFNTSVCRRLLFAVLIGVGLSGAIETAQHFMLAGMTQTDDVICNTLGAALGACAYLLSLLWLRLHHQMNHTKKQPD